MGKNNKKKNSPSKSKILVSVCTPTFNRRPFIPYMIKMYENQDFPKDKMEWVIIDDGTDPIEDLINEAKERIPNIKYFKYDEKMQLGKKRNLMHEKSVGEILVYMDDDDYYPSDRVSHAVQTLNQNKNALCAGSSEIYVYFKHINKVIQFGPYAPNHATAGTFAFKRELLRDGNTYDDEAALAEEKKFLKDYTVPFVQLDPKKTILVFSHDHNTFDKKKLLENPNPQVVKDSKWSVKDLVKEGMLRDFFMNKIHGLLKDYEPGLPKHKPDVLKQTEEIRLKREKMMEEERKKMIESGKYPQVQQPQIIAEGPNGEKKTLNMEEIIHLLKQKDEQSRNLQMTVNQLDYKVKDFEKTIKELENKNRVVELKSDNDDIVELLNKKIELLERQVVKLKNTSLPIDNKHSELLEKNRLLESKITLLESKNKDLQSNIGVGNIIMEDKSGNKRSLTNEDLIKVLKEKDDNISSLNGALMQAQQHINHVSNENELFKEKISILEHIKTKLERDKNTKENTMHLCMN